MPLFWLLPAGEKCYFQAFSEVKMKAEQKQPKADDSRAKADLQAKFLARAGWTGASVTQIKQDASVRHFYRVTKDGKTAVLMEACPPLEDTGAFELMREKLNRIGLTVPEIYHSDHAAGLVLMEDFGDERLFELVSGKKADIDKIYRLATDVLVHKFKADPAVALDQSVAYSDEYWLFRVEQFLLHYMPQVVGRTATTGEREDFLGLYRQAIEAAHDLPDVLLHGDYGAQNLYHLSSRPGVKALGLIDFQDMTDARGNMMGSPAFDLVFLLQDVRVDLPESLEKNMREHFLKQAGIANRAAFDLEYATIGAAQATKCLGLFARLGHVNGRKEYLPFIPYCFRNLQRNLSHPAMAGIRNWFGKNKIDLS